MPRRHSRDTIITFFRLVRSSGFEAALTRCGVPRRTGLVWLRRGEKDVLRRAKRRVGNQPNSERDAVVTELLAAMIPQADIARRLGVTRQMVHHIVKRLKRGAA